MRNASAGDIAAVPVMANIIRKAKTVRFRCGGSVDGSFGFKNGPQVPAVQIASEFKSRKPTISPSSVARRRYWQVERQKIAGRKSRRELEVGDVGERVGLLDLLELFLRHDVPLVDAADHE